MMFIHYFLILLVALVATCTICSVLMLNYRRWHQTIMGPNVPNKQKKKDRVFYFYSFFCYKLV